MLLLGGKEFEKSNYALQILATIISSTLNIVHNIFFIKEYGLYGAAFTTLISEFFVFVFCFIFIPNKNIYIDFIKIKYTIFNAISGSFDIIEYSFYIRNIVVNISFRLLFIVFGSVVIYVTMLLVMKDISKRVFNFYKEINMSISKEGENSK